jgi:hypothetical protein
MVCDFVRPELNGKLIVLGLMGVCPNVEIGVPYLDQPIGLTFLLTGDPGDGVHTGHVAIFDEDDQRIIAESVEQTIILSPKSATTLAPAFFLVFGHPGLFSLRLYVQDQEHFRATFRVVQGIQPAT